VLERISFVTCWLCALFFLGSPAAAQNPVARVRIYTDLHPEGIDTAFMQRPSWEVVRASVVRQHRQVDQTAAVNWSTRDSTKFRLRQRKPQSVALESPMRARLGRTLLIVDAGARHARRGRAQPPRSTSLDSATYRLAPKGTRQACTWMVTATGGRILTAQRAG
jgi:hypothetical protein